MSLILTDLGIFAAKIIIIFFFILAVLIALFALIAKAKEKQQKGRLIINHLNKKYSDTEKIINSEILPKPAFKKFLKKQKHLAQVFEKKEQRVFVIDFQGDIKASTVDTLGDEVTAVLNVATPQDEVVLRLESAGGMVHTYGLATAHLQRIRAKQIPLTITIDKIAASGGYMMACTANKILSAPFAIIGSIGVVVLLPNFNRLLKEHHIDVEQHTAGEFKRTLTLLGKNTEEGRKKLQEEIEDVHQLFKNLITKYRQPINIEKVATGEHWLGLQGINLNLVDEIKTSEAYLLEKSKQANIYEIKFEIKKPLLARLTQQLQAKVFPKFYAI